MNGLGDRPIRCQSEQNLDTQERLQQNSPLAQVANGAKTFADRASGENHQGEYDDRTDQVRQDAKCSVTERRAEDQLAENGYGGPCGGGPEGRRAGVFELLEIALPPLAGEQRDADYSHEKELRQGGVSGGNRRRQQEFDGQAAEHALSDH